jgi:hypothetical protein
VRLNRIVDTLQTLNCPVARATAAGRLANVTLLLADGEANLGELIAASTDDDFGSADDVISGLHNTLPRAAVGEPYQSDGDA